MNKLMFKNGNEDRSILIEMFTFSVIFHRPWFPFLNISLVVRELLSSKEIAPIGHVSFWQHRAMQTSDYVDCAGYRGKWVNVSQSGFEMTGVPSGELTSFTCTQKV